MQLSNNFYLSEFVDSQTAQRRGIDNTPNRAQLANLQQLAELMEEVRYLLGNLPISVSSGFRCPELNAAVNGARNSDHLTGSACDFTCPAFGSPYEVAKAIEESGIQFGQMIHEFGTWVHISIPNRSENNQVLTAQRKDGRVVYYRGII